MYNFITNFISLRIFNKNVLKLLWNYREIPVYVLYDLEEIGYSNAALVHELGHYMDFIFKEGYKHNTKIQEKNAWKEALRISDKYNLPLDIDFGIECLGSYGVKYKCLENRRNHA